MKALVGKVSVAALFAVAALGLGVSPAAAGTVHWSSGSCTWEGGGSTAAPANEYAFDGYDADNCYLVQARISFTGPGGGTLFQTASPNGNYSFTSLTGSALTTQSRAQPVSGGLWTGWLSN